MKKELMDAAATLRSLISEVRMQIYGQGGDAHEADYSILRIGARSTPFPIQSSSAESADRRGER